MTPYEQGKHDALEAMEKIIEGKMEKWADIEHERWSSWQRHLHGKLIFNGTDWILGNEWFERWNLQIHTPYCNLSSKEQDGDREQVRPYIDDLLAEIHTLKAQPINHKTN